MKTLLISTGLALAALSACNNNSGASGTGGAGASTGMGGAAGAAPMATITGDNGDFDKSFLITSCASAGTGFDCPNPPPAATGCPTTAWMPPTGATVEGIGSTYDETFTVTATDPNKIYDVTVHAQGQVEGRTYTGGMRAAMDSSGNPVLPDPNGVANNLLYIGGKPGTTRVDYNVFMLTIAPPDGGQPIDGEPTFYAFNSVDTTHEGQHFNYQIDETFTFKVQSGFVVTLTNHDSNCIAIKNCGVGGPYNFSSSALCEAQARTISAVTLPATFMGKALPNGGAQPFQTQFVNFQITSIVAE